MSKQINSNISNSISSLCPANGRQTVGDGAAYLADFADPGGVLAMCQMQHSGHGATEDTLYYSTTFSGGWVTANLVPTTKHTTDIPLIHPGPGLFPRSIPVKSCSVDAPTPPLTPDSGSDYYGSQDSIGEQQQQQKDALDFLLTVFPHDGFKALPHTKRLAISAPNMGASFDGIVLDHPGHPKTLYVDAKNAELVSLRESIVALLDLADDTLSCSALIIVLERSSPVLGDLLHSLMYVGGTVVTKPLFKVDPAFVLVGLEI